MKNTIAIMRRDLGAYFTSPIGYIFMIVFITISVGLYITSFFSFPQADMRPYFNNLPILLCVFIPAVTMRVWAEERKENTWELLLTFPMKAWELVLGKFFACLVFFTLTLAGTFTVPLMLIALGAPDPGAIAGGYVGTVLLGGLFLAIGVFFSAFFKDQIVSFVVSLLVCFMLFLVGTQFIASYIDGMMPGLGSMLSNLVGVFNHYEAFTRGVIELADLIFFLGWIAVFLTLNKFYIEGRGRPRVKMIFTTAVVASVAIGLMINWLLTGTSLFRIDATQDKIYTVSEASKAVLSKIDAPVQVKVYITPRDKMPTGMTQLEQGITDKLEEIRLASGGKLQYSTVYLEVANVLADPSKDNKEDEKNEEKAIEKRMLDKGVEPFSVRAQSQDEVTNKLVYSSIGIGYKSKKEEIIPRVMPENIEELEYRVVSTVHKLTRDKAPIVALVAPKEAVNIDPQTRAMLQQMGQQVPESEDPYVYLEQILGYEKYEVKRVELNDASPLPEEYDTLAVINPRALNDRQRYEINRALVSGKNVIVAVQNYEWDYRPTRSGMSVSKREEKPEINALLESYGLGVSEEILMDSNRAPLTVQGGNDLASMLGGGQTVNLPMHILVNNSSMDTSMSITNRLSTIFYLWGSALNINDETLKKNNLEAKIIMKSSPKAWTVPAAAPLTGTTFDPPASGMKQFPLMAVVKGQFPDAYQGKERPAWPQEQPQPGQPPKPPAPEEGAAKPITPAPGKLVLLGCSELFRKNFLQAGNLDLFLNSVDAITLGDDLAKIRGRKPIDRSIDRPTSAQSKLWKGFNYVFASVIIAAIGIVTSVMRRRARNAYTMAYGANQD